MKNDKYNNNINLNENKKSNIKMDFKLFFIEQAGLSQLKDCQYQQVSEQFYQEDIKEKKQGDDPNSQFEEVEEEEVNIGGIKAAQFWSGIKMPSQPIQVSKQVVNFQVRCVLSTGFNSLGRDNIFYLDGRVCKAIGCVLAYDERIYPKHSKKIITISYNHLTSQILTATEGPNPELFLWKYNLQKQMIQWKKRFFLGKKCEDIYGISFFKQTLIIAVQHFTLHKCSVLHVFDKLSGKKMTQLKVGKFYDLQLLAKQQQESRSNEQMEYYGNQQQWQQKESCAIEQRIFFANEEGISQLIISSNQIIKTQLLHESVTITCLCPFYSPHGSKKLQILTGDREGNIKATFSSKQQIKAHQGWIFEIKHKKINSIDYFFSLGAIDFHLGVISYSPQNKNKFNILHKIQLNSYGRSIQYDQKGEMLLVGERDGCCEEFLIQELVSQSKQTFQITRKQTPSLKCFQSKSKSKPFIINLSNKNQLNQGKKVYAYGHSSSRNLRIFAVENSQEVLFKEIEQYPLRSYPQTLDICNSLLAYTYDVQSKEQQLSKTQSSAFNKKSYQKKQNQFEKSILVIQDIESKQLIKKVKLKQGQRYKCTVLKFSPSGRYLALGDSEGRVFVYAMNQKRTGVQCQSQAEGIFIMSTQKAHKQAVCQLVWSKNQKHLKTTSLSQLYYWSISTNSDFISTNKTQYTTTLKQEKPMSLRDIRWVSLNKYSWQTKRIWQKTSFMEELNKFCLLQYLSVQQVSSSTTIKEIASQKRQLILTSTAEGQLRVYNCPAHQSKYQSIKLSNQPFQLIQYLNDHDSFSFLVIIQGIIMVIQLSVADQQQ